MSKQLCPTSWNIGRQPDCDACAAGGLINFPWRESLANPRIRPVLGVFRPVESLRWGHLFKCTVCDQPWYLNGDGNVMHFVPRDRLSLIREWNEHPLTLSAEHLEKLEAIGRTPPDVCGNGAQFHETPCGVVTKSGERFDLAIVSRQQHAPFEELRKYRLVSEI